MYYIVYIFYDILTFNSYVFLVYIIVCFIVLRCISCIINDDDDDDDNDDDDDDDDVDDYWCSYQSKTAKKILDTILNIQPKDSSSGSGGKTREATVYHLCDDMLGKPSVANFFSFLVLCPGHVRDK